MKNHALTEAMTAVLVVVPVSGVILAFYLAALGIFGVSCRAQLYIGSAAVHELINVKICLYDNVEGFDSYAIGICYAEVAVPELVAVYGSIFIYGLAF